MEVHRLEESKKGAVLVVVGSPEEAGRAASGVRAAKSSESKKGE